MAELCWTNHVLARMGMAKACPGLLKAYGLGGVVHGVAESPGGRRHRLIFAALRGAIAQIDDAIGAEAPWLLLKGQPLEQRLFANQIGRATGDVDLLVLPGDLCLFRRRLRQLGYRRQAPPRMWAHNQEAWHHEEHRTIVELHWALALPGVPSPPLHRLFADRQAYELGSAGAGGGRRTTTVDVLDDHWLFFHLILHFHHHFGFAKGLLDIAGWCDCVAPTADLGRLEADLRAYRLWGVAQWPLHTIAALTGLRPPLLDEQAGAAPRLLARLSAQAMTKCLARRSPTDLEATAVAAMPRVGTTMGVAIHALSMLAIDGDTTQKARAFCRPWLLGPHRLGRVVWKTPLSGLVDLEGDHALDDVVEFKAQRVGLVGEP